MRLLFPACHVRQSCSRCLRAPLARLQAVWPVLAPAGIIAGAGILALVWVFRVPIYMLADEPMNFDYGLAIQAHGGLFWVHGASYERLPDTVHPYSAYLLERTHASWAAFHPARKMPADYGTAEFFATLNRDTPCLADLTVDSPNKPFAVYPFGYYGLLALWIQGLSLIDGGPVWLFFGARCLSVLLFTAGLGLTHATLRLLTFGRAFSLLITACVGFFPLSMSVAAAVQTDNLSFTLISLCFYLSLRSRQELDRAWPILILGLSFGALLVTKPHFFLCVLVPVALMLLAETQGRRVPWTRRLALAVVLFAPSLLAGTLYLSMTWGTVKYYFPASNDDDAVIHSLRWFQTACWDFFAGLTHETFWERFGWHDLFLIIRGRRIQEMIRFCIQVSAWVLLGLTLLRLEQVTARLVRLAHKGRALCAVRLALSNPVLNSYFLFTVFMFWIYIHTSNRFGAQGRNWWPMLLPIFLTGIVYAPRALSLRSARRALTVITLGGLLAYCALGSIYGLRAIEKRYYASDRTVAPLVGSLRPDDTRLGDRQEDLSP
ncbi:MAG: hypothetical protein K2R98_29385 [Gemmataceae bacterium]|nr:hypothetical protein [Gemmataceae bacterium]